MLNSRKYEDTLSNISLSSESKLFSELLPNNKLNLYRNNYNLKGGGQKQTIDCLNAFNNRNVELALYILNNNNCDCCIQDKNGNTVLHHLAMCSNQNCLNTLQLVLKQSSNKHKFIDVQNNEGQTALLLCVLNNNFQMAYILEKSGADKKIKDNYGNYVECDDPEEQLSQSEIEQSIILSDLLSEKQTPQPAVNNNTNIYIIEPHNNGNTNLSEISTSSLPITLPRSSKSDLSTLDLSTDDFINSLSERYNTSKSVPSRSITDIDSLTSVSDRIKPKNDFEILSSVDTEKMIEDIERKALQKRDKKMEETSEDSYLDRMASKLDERMKDKRTLSSLDSERILQMIESAQKKEEESKLDTSIDTDKLIQAIEGKSEGKSEDRILRGGTNIFKKNLNSNNMNGGSKKSSKKNKKNKLRDEYTESEDNITNNYLARLVRSKKDEFHEQVLHMIKDMLKDGKFYRGSEQIEDNERNALLIKRYLYRYLSEKNPELSGMDKILNIKNMTEDEMVKLVKNIPDLDDLEKQIQQHLTEKAKHKEHKSETETETETKSETETESETETKTDKKKKDKKEKDKKDKKKK